MFKITWRQQMRAIARSPCIGTPALLLLMHLYPCLPYIAARCTPAHLSDSSNPDLCPRFAGSSCRWLLSPSLLRPTDITIDMSGLASSDLLQVTLPHGLIVLLWPGMKGAQGELTWSKTVDTGDVLLELGTMGRPTWLPAAHNTSIGRGPEQKHLASTGVHVVECVCDGGLQTLAGVARIVGIMKQPVLSPCHYLMCTPFAWVARVLKPTTPPNHVHLLCHRHNPILPPPACVCCEFIMVAFTPRGGVSRLILNVGSTGWHHGVADVFICHCQLLQLPLALHRHAKRQPADHAPNRCPAQQGAHQSEAAAQANALRETWGRWGLLQAQTGAHHSADQVA